MRHKHIVSTFALLLLMTFTSGCALIWPKMNQAEYRIETSMLGAEVYLANGKLIGETPLDTTFEQLSEVIDGRFATIIIKKDGYHTRVVLFDITDSVNIKIDLSIDKEFKTLMVSDTVKREVMLRDKVKNLEERLRILKHESKIKKERNDKLSKIVEEYHKKYETILAEIDKVSASNRKLSRDLASTEAEVEKTKLTVPRPLLNVPGVEVSDTNQLSCPETVKTVVKYKDKKCPKAIVKHYPLKRMNVIITDLLGIQFLIINGKLAEAKKQILELEEKISSSGGTLHFIGLCGDAVKSISRGQEAY